MSAVVPVVAALRQVRRPAAPPAPPLLCPSGARIVLGDHVGADGLPSPLTPARDSMFGPRGVAFLERGLAVADTGHHRLLVWRGVPETDNAPADFLIGQPDFFSEGRNAYGAPGPATLNVPTGVASDGCILAVADAWNHRVLIWRSLPTTTNQPADVVLGQVGFSGALANRGAADARADTLNWCYGVTIAGGRLFVADTGNRRVLIWNEIPSHNGQPADLVLGQSDMITRDDNAGEAAGASGMRWPHTIAVAGESILVADAGDSRIMVWNRMPNADGAPCAFVLGQKSFHEIDHNRAAYEPGERTLNMPYGLAADGDMLLCADTANSRLIGYKVQRLAQGARAEALSGQKTYADKGDNRWRFATRDSVCWPFAVAANGGLVAIADTGNNRVLLWDRAS